MGALVTLTLSAAAIGCGSETSPEDAATQDIVVERTWAKELSTDLKSGRDQAEELAFFSSSLSNGFRVDDEMLGHSLERLRGITKTTQDVVLAMALKLADKRLQRDLRGAVEVPDAQFADVLDSAKALGNVDLPELSAKITKLAVAIERRSPDRAALFDATRQLTRKVHDQLARMLGVVQGWVDAQGTGSPGGSVGGGGSPGGGVPACVDCNIHGCFSAGGGCNVHGCFAPGGGCNIHGCFAPGGGCNVHGCFAAGGRCTVHGCVQGRPSLADAVCRR